MLPQQLMLVVAAVVMEVIQEDLEEQVVEDPEDPQELVLVLMEQITLVVVEEVYQLTTLQLVEQVVLV